VRRLQRPVGVAAGLVLLGLALWRGAGSRTDPYVQVFGYAALSLAAAALIASALPGGRAGWWRQVLASPGLQTFGKYSYAIYVFQYPIVALLDSVVRPVLDVRSGGAVLPVSLTIFVLASALSLLAARVSWALVEAPALSLKRYFPSRTAA
jgi:peptidoglycan/LPS O-acetylase OafA/YrhL